MTKYKFGDIALDKNIEELTYLPYFDGLNKEYVDKYNSFLLKKYYEYHKDQKSLRNYFNYSNTYIKDIDRYYYYIAQKKEIDLLFKKISFQFRILFLKLKDKKSKIFIKKHYIVVIENLRNEIKRLKLIIKILENYTFKNERKRIVNIYHLICFIIFIFSFIISFFFKY